MAITLPRGALGAGYGSIRPRDLWAGAASLVILLAVALGTVKRLADAHADALAEDLRGAAEHSARLFEDAWTNIPETVRGSEPDARLRMAIEYVGAPKWIGRTWAWILLEDGRLFPLHDGEVERFWSAPSGIDRLSEDQARSASGSARFPVFIPRKIDAISSYASFELSDGTRGQWVITADRAAAVTPFGRVALVMGAGSLLAFGLVVAAFVRAIRDSGRAHHAQRETSMLQAAILDGAEQAIISTDPSGLIRTWSAGAERLLGYNAKETKGKMQIIHLHDTEELTCRLREIETSLGTPVSLGVGALIAYAALGRSDGREWIYRRRDGSRVPVSVGISTLTDQNRRLTGFLVVSTDITERRAVEAELMRARDAAEGAARAKSEFLATMSHEIRTPLHGVIGMTGLLLETPLDPMQLEYSATIRSSADTLLALVNEILDFSKIESGKLAMESIEFSIQAVLNDVFDMVAGRARSADLDFACILDPRVPVRVLGDPMRLRQVLLNLVDNALKFTSEGSVALRVTIDGTSSSGATMVRFTVADSGIGIPAEQRNRLFQPFTQGDGSTTRRYGGTGLGLAICGRIVELMGGRIDVTSEPGIGSTFGCSIPFLATQGDMKREEPSRLRTRRVLLVSAAPTTRGLLDEMLTHLGARWRTVQTRGEALVELRREAHRDPYAAVLVHCDPKSRDWVDLPRERKSFAELAGLEFCLLTLNGSLSHRSTAVQIGYSEVLLLPVRQDALATALCNMFDPQSRSESSHRQATTKPDPQGIRERQRFRILVAEDNLVNQKVARGILNRLGYRVDCVANGREAVDAIRETPFDLVLMDCLMPEMDGFAATKAIRALPGSRIPIVAMTANAMNGDRDRCLAAGMDEYVSKPIHVGTLDSVIQRFLSKNGALDERPAA